MKLFFSIVLIVLLLITFSDKEPIKPYRDSFYQQILVWIPDNWKNENLAVIAIQREFMSLSKDLGIGQKQLLAEAAANKVSILRFRQRYCLESEFHPLLHGQLLEDSCAIIDKYYYRFDDN